MTHDEAVALLGAYALDAVPPEEAVLVAAHVAECPRCTAELDAHREVAGMLGVQVSRLNDRVSTLTALARAHGFIVAPWNSSAKSGRRHS